MEAIKLKEYCDQIEANQTQVTADFVKNTMNSIKELVEDLKGGTDYEGYVDLGEDPDNDGLFMIGDLIHKEGLKYTLILTKEIDNQKFVISEKYELLISIAHCGE